MCVQVNFCDGGRMVFLIFHLRKKSTEKLLSPTDMSRNVGTTIAPETGVNGTYSTRLFAKEAIAVLKKHFMPRQSKQEQPPPLYMYVAPQNVHLACGSKTSKTVQGIQSPCATVNMFPRVKNDTFKGQSAVTTELDFLVGNISATLQKLGQWNNTIIIFTSDNGGPLDHTTNWPLRGGKHTFWDGGVRVLAGIGGGFLPAVRRGTVWDGLMHSADWYRTVVEGMAGGEVSNRTGPTPDDSFDLWDSILGASAASPRHEVIHQVSNGYFTENVVAMRLEDFKLIIGNPGDARALRWPALAKSDVTFGMTGGSTRDGGTSCLSGIVTGKVKDTSHACQPGCLFDLHEDAGELNNLYGRKEHAQMIELMRTKLHVAGKFAPPPSSYWRDPTEGLADIWGACPTRVPRCSCCQNDC